VAVVPRRSRLLDGFAGALLVAVLAVAFTAPSASFAGLALLLGVALVREWRAARAQTGPRAAVQRLERDGQGRWWLTLRSGARSVARLRGEPFVTTALIVIDLADGEGRCHRLALFPDSAEPQMLRRLRLALRTAASQGAQSDSPGGA
jgi:hypothetical protein